MEQSDQPDLPQELPSNKPERPDHLNVVIAVIGTLSGFLMMGSLGLLFLSCGSNCISILVVIPVLLVLVSLILLALVGSILSFLKVFDAWKLTFLWLLVSSQLIVPSFIIGGVISIILEDIFKVSNAVAFGIVLPIIATALTSLGYGIALKLFYKKTKPNLSTTASNFTA